jgi:hypothetical protein
MSEDFVISQEMEGYIQRQAQEYENAEAYDNWMPPDGTHVAIITGFKDGQNKNGAWLQLKCSLLDPDPDLTDKEFSIWYRENAPQGILKSDANALAGKKVEDIREAIKVLGTAPGKTINIKVNTNEKGFTNVKIVDVVPDVN